MSAPVVLLRIEQTAAYLGCSIRRVQQMAALQLLTAYQIPGQKGQRFSPQEALAAYTKLMKKERKPMRDVCIIQAHSKPCSQYLLRVNADVWSRVDRLSREAGRSRSSIACELLGFALDRAEIRADVPPCMEDEEEEA